MRVLFLAPQPFYRLRGMCIAQKSCLEALGRMGVEVDVLTYPFGEDVEIPGVRIRRLPRLPGMRDVPIGPSWQKIALAPLMALAAAALLRTRRYDAVHACEESALMLAPLRRLLRCRFVYDMDDVLSARVSRSGFLKSSVWLRLIEALERCALRSADFVLTNSRDTTDYALRFARRERVHFYDHVPPLPADPGWSPERRAAFRRARGWEGRRVILYAGNLEPYQGVDLLLEALPAVFARLPDAVCAIIGGEPAQRERAARAASSSGLAGRVGVLGQYPLAEAFRFMKAADVLVSPMTQEKAVPMKIYAYLAAGVPIVATDLPNHRQLLGEGEAALPDAEPAALAAALCASLERPARVPRPIASWSGRDMERALLAAGLAS